MHALRVLEFDQVLERLSYHCETPLGVEICQKLQPSFVGEEVWVLLERTQEGYDCVTKAAPPPLASIKDLRQPAIKAKRGAVLGGVEIYDIGAGLNTMRVLKSFLNGRKETTTRLWAFGEQLPENRKIEDAVLTALEPNGDVKDAASAHLAGLRQRKNSTSRRLMDKVQGYISGKTRDLLSDPIYTVRDGRFVIPLKAENRNKIRGIVHDSSATGQTIYVEPEDVLQLGNQLREIEGAEQAEIQRILAALSARVGAVADQYVAGVEAAATIDVALGKARYGVEYRGCIPERLQSPCLEMEGGRHPLLNPNTVVPLDIKLGQGHSVLITGPNTGGKTVAIKTVGLAVLMAQAGLMTPARHARFGHFSQVWADIGDEQSLTQSLSTFSGHIKNISEALRALKAGALVLLDEIGAGTDPAEGAALAKAILVTLHQSQACILASTHYGELKAFAYETDGFINAAMEFDGKTLQPTFKLRLGAPGASQALRIAERYGIPADVVRQAKEALSTQHQDMALMMERLEQAQKLARQAQSEADRRLADLRKQETAVAQKLEEADEIKRTAHRRAQETIQEALREMRIEADEILADVKQNPGKLSEARRQLSEIQTRGRELSEGFKTEERPGEAGEEIRKGMTVRAIGYAQTGIVLEDPHDGGALVQMGALKITLSLAQLKPIASPGRAPKSNVKITLQKAMSASTELNLRHQRYEDAERDLERFVDDAILAGIPSVRIVHGKGEGILRKMTQEFLRRRPEVASVRDADASEGGHGVTVAVFK
jgi:DNA mismatch repair protein MutS2